MFYNSIEGINTNNVISTASALHHVNLAYHWTIAHQGSQFTSCSCIYAQETHQCSPCIMVTSRSLETGGMGCWSRWKFFLCNRLAIQPLHKYQQSSQPLNISLPPWITSLLLILFSIMALCWTRGMHFLIFFPFFKSYPCPYCRLLFDSCPIWANVS